MAALGSIASFLNKYLLGYAVGTAAGPSLEPFVQDLVNSAWQANRVRPLEAEAAAELVAEGHWTDARGDSEASDTGIPPDVFPELVELARRAPEVPMILALWRRGLIGEGQVDEALAKLRVKPGYRPAIKATRDVLLSPQEAANAWQQGFMDEGAASEEAARSGVTPDRSEIQRELAGLPPGAMDGLRLLRRGLVDEGTYRQIVREGHTKVKYTDALLGLRNEVISARDAAELWLRGWVTEAQAKAIGALTGYDAQSMEWLYLNRGRPATTRQVFLGLRHGAKRGDPAGDIDPDYLAAVKNSNLRPEYANLLWAQRYTYPSLFQLSRLVQAGALTVERGKQILWFQGYDQPDIDALGEYWGQASGPVAQKWLDRARGRLFTVAHNEYQDESIDAATAQALLVRIGATAAEAARVLEVWDAERGVNRLELSPTQIKKAWKAGLYDHDTAIAELVERHMTEEDAATFLAS
jgi:hypothetical protein